VVLGTSGPTARANEEARLLKAPLSEAALSACPVSLFPLDVDRLQHVLTLVNTSGLG
jgi:hypothetical protein